MALINRDVEQCDIVSDKSWTADIRVSQRTSKMASKILLHWLAWLVDPYATSFPLLVYLESSSTNISVHSRIRGCDQEMAVGLPAPSSPHPLSSSVASKPSQVMDDTDVFVNTTSHSLYVPLSLSTIPTPTSVVTTSTSGKPLHQVPSIVTHVPGLSTSPISQSPSEVVVSSFSFATAACTSHLSATSSLISISASPSPSSATSLLLPPDMDDYDLKADTRTLLQILAKLSISASTTTYQPREERVYPDELGVFCKNLFLKDRKGQFYLVICPEDNSIDLKTLKVKLRANRNFSFGSVHELASILQVCPGEVTPFSLMHSSAQSVRIAISRSLTLNSTLQLNFHPFDSRLTTRISAGDLERFVNHCEHQLERFH